MLVEYGLEALVEMTLNSSIIMVWRVRS